MRKQVLQAAKQQQAEKLAELGTRLSHARLQREMSLDDVAARTHIQVRLLLAIEEGRLSDLPEPVYVQSFIRQFGNAVGLNGVHLASEFSTTPVVLPQRLNLGWLPFGQLRPAHLYLVYLALVVGAVQGLSYLMNQSSSQPQLTAESLQKFKESLPVSPVPMGPSLGARAANPTATSSIAPDAAGKPVRVGLVFKDQSWIRISVDGKQEFEGVLPQGTARTWAAEKQVVVRAGNAGGVMAAFNEGQAKPLGEPGTVQEVAFPPDPKLATLPVGTIAAGDSLGF
ncbi:helix-turn-helix domain-containing protein [Alkalinema pantanalense CENA528]|uniref:helix-turn-helix domain-containing protein n=1 Tax=Alkalinema pantanalense TaxID=1620705 RepID=UPI003D6E7EAC